MVPPETDDRNVGSQTIEENGRTKGYSDRAVRDNLLEPVSETEHNTIIINLTLTNNLVGQLLVSLWFFQWMNPNDEFALCVLKGATESSQKFYALAGMHIVLRIVWGSQK